MTPMPSILFTPRFRGVKPGMWLLGNIPPASLPGAYFVPVSTP
jgi:hypothetical protein